MRGHRKVLAIIFAVFVIAIASTSATLQNQNRTTPLPQEEAGQYQEPIADYTAHESIDAQQRALRHARGRRYNLQEPNLRADQVRPFIITEDSQTTFGGFPSHARPEPALPLMQSDAVVIGDVTDARAQLSEDRTSIYSGFIVRIVDALENTSATPLAPDSSITATRYGGAVRFPSGRIVRRGFSGKPLPRIGRRYVFFLKYNEEGQDFSIVTAYELRAGRVFPLDGISISGRVVEQLAAHQNYRGRDEASFLNEVREAIARTPLSRFERRDGR